MGKGFEWNFFPKINGRKARGRMFVIIKRKGKENQNYDLILLHTQWDNYNFLIRLMFHPFFKKYF